ncbi:MAG TPA: D-Ala-D-Ala carboxypeptidase family metallohydrolase [Beijerinckiaceae bacterium]|nr:D-Ala-D-Ala carboxypeptidase family metallohydrolase [Beijerinckiaceae bacterium]
MRQAAPPAPSDAAAPPEPTAPAAEPTLAGYLQARENAPLECLPAELRTVLADVAARFGAVAVVSTDRLNTDNHSPGSAREKMHQACRAVDFRPEPGRVDEIKAYLRSRREIGGVESYRNGVVHVDLAAAPRPRAQAPRPAEPDPVETTASAPAAPNPFAAVEPPDIVR